MTALFFVSTGFAQNDPTMPPNWHSQSQTGNIPKNIALTGIFVSDDINTAIINGQSLHTGDFIQGYEVTKIIRDAVTLKNNQGVFTVPLTSSVTSPATSP